MAAVPAAASPDARPLRVAVVGSGPAGFYAANALLSADPPIEVDMIERLPTPWGLVRLGVAPDHPKLKDVSRAFERTAQKPGFRFFGNVEVGAQITHDDLVRLYDAVVYTVGAQTDNRLGVPGEELPGSWSATQFVAWYNGHPDFQDLEFDLSAERAVVVGAGNVALDVARMLALTLEELQPTDTTNRAIDAIAGSGINEIVLLARRGPAQAAFTTPELKELGELAGADVVVDPAELELDEASAASLEGNTNATRNMEVLREFASREPMGKPRRIVLRFLVSPVAILGEDRVEGVETVQNELVTDGERISARATDRRETIPAGIVFRSVGYRGVALPDLPFDEARGTLLNDRGRMLDESGDPLGGVYCAGWIKRGPTGVIGTNKKDATETVQLLLEDVAAGRLVGVPEPRDLAELLAERGGDPVLYAGWEEIDRVEKAAGEPHGRPRVKLHSWDSLLIAARGDKAG
ncbi:MAG: ferredoxin/flavodoxin---NADP+ reductase [Gaiellaceae bacterium]|nr:ferredoxin/flavodoxin---NADP+ reductase [Gaiellaceae bacterium]